MLPLKFSALMPKVDLRSVKALAATVAARSRITVRAVTCVAACSTAASSPASVVACQIEKLLGPWNCTLPLTTETVRSGFAASKLYSEPIVGAPALRSTTFHVASPIAVRSCATIEPRPMLEVVSAALRRMSVWTAKVEKSTRRRKAASDDSAPVTVVGRTAFSWYGQSIDLIR
uniref:Unannotated protein n=1 Tax=freshwater metagenome TaxID=449393 RepID=A0A6J5ZCN5_9ZZZZ